MSPDPGPQPSDEPATALMAALAIEIDAILSRFHLSEREAESLLREVLLLTLYRWDRIDSREIWLLALVRRTALDRLRRRAVPA